MKIFYEDGSILDDFGTVGILNIVHTRTRYERVYASRRTDGSEARRQGRQCSQVVLCRNRCNRDHAVYIFHDSMTKHPRTQYERHTDSE